MGARRSGMGRRALGRAPGVDMPDDCTSNETYRELLLGLHKAGNGVRGINNVAFILKFLLLSAQSTSCRATRTRTQTADANIMTPTIFPKELASPAVLEHLTLQLDAVRHEDGDSYTHH